MGPCLGKERSVGDASSSGTMDYPQLQGSPLPSITSQAARWGSPAQSESPSGRTSGQASSGRASSYLAESEFSDSQLHMRLHPLQLGPLEQSSIQRSNPLTGQSAASSTSRRATPSPDRRAGDSIAALTAAASIGTSFRPERLATPQIRLTSSLDEPRRSYSRNASPEERSPKASSTTPRRKVPSPTSSQWQSMKSPFAGHPPLPISRDEALGPTSSPLPRPSVQSPRVSTSSPARRHGSPRSPRDPARRRSKAPPRSRSPRPSSKVLVEDRPGPSNQPESSKPHIHPEECRCPSCMPRMYEWEKTSTISVKPEWTDLMFVERHVQGCQCGFCSPNTPVPQLPVFWQS